jgi:hypothetical protein
VSTIVDREVGMGMPSSRRRTRLLSAAAGLVFALCGASAADARSGQNVGMPHTRPTATAASAPADAVTARSRARLHSFVRWLHRGHARGFIGEVGWPGNDQAGGDARWNGVARDWYRQAQAAGLWVTAWAAGDFWQPSYKLLVYSTGTWPQLAPNPQADVLEAQRAYPELRGVNVAGAEFGETPVDQPTSAFSNEHRGVDGKDYTFPEASSLQYLAGRGVRLVRLPLRWERLQPQPGGALDEAYVARLRESRAAANAAGQRVIVDLHNYGAYYLASGDHGVRRPIGSPELPVAAFADVWRRLAGAIGDLPAVEGYGLMNEPVGMAGPRTWENASRAALRAIRRAHDRHTVLVAGYDWSSVDGFARNHPRGPWLRVARIRYEGHQYFDADNTGRYLQGYGSERTRALRSGFGQATR